MNKALENIIEIGVNLLVAMGVLMLISTVWNLGRDAVISMDKQKIQEARAGELAEFSQLNDSEVEYARMVELITHYAGTLDIYVDSTVDGGAILISSKTGCINVQAAESWATVEPSDRFAITDPYSRIGGLNTNYYTNEARMLAEAQQLLKADMTAKIGQGAWKVYVAVNNEKVGNCEGKKITATDYVTGLRFNRTR